MDEWKECELEHIATVQTGPFGSQLKNEQYINGGTPVVTVEHVKDFRVLDFTYPSVTENDRQRLDKYHLTTGDIVFTRVGSVDLSAFIAPHQDGWLFSSRMLRVRINNNEICPRFLSYYFQKPAFREHIRNIAVGATMPSINTEILASVPIAYPTLEEQKAIAEVLSSLDDKIDLLHRQNKTLEALAETLFRQMFIENARDDEKPCHLANDCNVIGGFAFKSKDFTDVGIPVVKIKNITGGQISLEDSQFISEDKAVKIDHKYRLYDGDIVMAMTGATIGKIGLIETNGYDYLLLNQRVAVLRCEHQALIWAMLNTVALDEQILNAANGVAQANISADGIMSIEIPALDNDKVESFNTYAIPEFKKIITNLKEIRILEQLRDTLLPKLMSGEVRVSYQEV